MKLASRLSLIVLVVAGLLMLAGCSSGCPTNQLGGSGSGGAGGGISQPGTVCGPGPGPGPGTSSAYFYYVGSSDIQAASLSTAGAFAPLTPYTPAVIPSSFVNDMIVVNKTFLYVPMTDSLTIQAFTIDHASGALTPIAGSPFPTAGADSVASDPTGRFLFAGNATTGQVSAFQINSAGVLTPAPGSPFTAFNLIFSQVLAVDGTGKFLYVGQDASYLPIYAFSIDQNNGALSQLVGSPFALGVAGVRTDYSGKFAIGLSGTTFDNHLYVFAIDPTTGALSAVANSPFATTMATPLNLRIHPSSQFVYSFGADSNGFYTSTEGYTIDPVSGALTAITGSPFTTLSTVFDCKFDQGGSAAFCGDAAPTAFSVYNVNTSTGVLTQTVPDLAVTNANVAFAPTN